MMKQYSEYKDSGVKWIGDIPSHWDTIRIKRVSKFNPTKTKEIKSLVGYAPMECIRTGYIESKEIEADKLSSGLTYFEDGDLVVAKVTPCFENGNIAIAKNLKNGCAYGSSELFVFRCEKIDRKYLFYYMQDEKFKHKCCSTMTGAGGLKRVSAEFIRNAYISFPPLPEQQAIVSYLDAKVAKIDSYIATATKKIAALDELKQVTIANAVTKGINPNAPMKDSGIPWIGMVPENWKTLRAKNIFERQFREVKDDDDIVTCFRDGQVTLRKNRRTDGFTESIKEIGYQGIRKGDLVIHQMDAFAGSIGVSDSDGKGTPVYICCLPKGESNVFYYAYLLREMARTGFIKSLYRGIRERSSDFRFETFAVQWLPVFPLSEQNEIVTYIDRKVAQIDQMRTAELSQIEKLKEYKQRLISDVVTGKVKVTND